MRKIAFLTAVALWAIESRAQTISELTYTTTDTTIVGTWTTDVPSKSSIACSGKKGVDNGVAASSTSHQAIVAGLVSSTTYSCTVTSGTTTSGPEDVTTEAPAVRKVFTSVTFGFPKRLTNHGDTNYTFVSNNDRTYITDCDGFGFFPGIPNAGANMQVDILTNEQNLVGATVNLLQNYGKAGTFNGSDGPAGEPLTNKVTGIFGISGNLYLFATRQLSTGGAWYNNVIKSRDHGKTWNNWQTPFKYSPLGSPQGPQSSSEDFPLPSKTYGFVSPIRYGPDDGTLGYNTAGNQIDGANAYVYEVFVKSPFKAPSTQASPAYLMRIPRIQMEEQSTTAYEYWTGPSAPTPADFVDDQNWSKANAKLTAILDPPTALTWPVITFIAGVNSYLLVADANGVPAKQNSTYMYSSPTPAGPWAQIYYQPTIELYYGFMPMHRDAFSNTDTDQVKIRVIYSGGANSFTTYYFPTISTLTLSTAPLVSNNFVQGNGTSTELSGAKTSLAYAGNNTVGDLLVVSFHGKIELLDSITDTMGNDWTLVYKRVDGGATLDGWGYAFSKATGPNTVSLKWDAPNSGVVISIGEWNGPNAFRDADNGNRQEGASPSSNAIVTAGGDLLIGVVGTSTGGSYEASGKGWTLRAQGKTNGMTYTAISDNLSALFGATKATFTTDVGHAGIAGIGAFYNDGRANRTKGAP